MPDALTSNLKSLAFAPDRVKILLIVTRGGDVSLPDDPRFASIASTVADAKIKTIPRLVPVPAAHGH